MIIDGFFPLQFSGERQWEIFSLACLLGIALGAVYEVIRALRRGFALGAVLENVLDFFYALFFFFCFFVFSVAQTGDMRVFTLLSMLVGAAAERYTLGRLTLPIMAAVFGGVRAIWQRTFKRAIAKITQKTRSVFVENIPKSKKSKKSVKSS